MSTAFALLYYVAAAILVAGLGAKIVQYARTPAPLKIPTNPAPLTPAGAALRVTREALVFESLFKANKGLWIMAVLFHFGLFAVLARHGRYFQDPVWLPVQMVQFLAIPAALAMIAGLLMLLARRLLVPRIAYITGPSDLLMLALLLAIALSGLAMTGAVHTDIVMVKSFFRGLMGFDIRPLPTDPLLLTHLGLVAALMIVFPFSKLLHVPGVFFSPTRNQCDNPREKRHLAPWAAKYDAGRN